MDSFNKEYLSSIVIIVMYLFITSSKHRFNLLIKDLKDYYIPLLNNVYILAIIVWELIQH